MEICASWDDCRPAYTCKYLVGDFQNDLDFRNRQIGTFRIGERGCDLRFSCNSPSSRLPAIMDHSICR